MKNNLLKLALSAMTLLPMGAWAIDFGTEVTVSTELNWNVNSLTTDEPESSNYTGNTPYAYNGVYIRKANNAGTSSGNATWSDGTAVSWTSILNFGAATESQSGITSQERTAGGNTSIRRCVAFNAAVAGTCYALVRVNSVGTKVSLYHKKNEVDNVSPDANNKYFEIKYSCLEAGAFYIAADGPFKVAAIRFVPGYPVQIGATGYATYGNTTGKHLVVPTGLTAYAASSNGTAVVLTAKAGVRMGEGYVLKGTPNTYYYLTEGEDPGSSSKGGEMKRVNADIENFSASVTEESTQYYQYILGDDNGTAKFFVPNGTSTLKKGKAYLKTTVQLSASAARGIDIVFADDDVTGISATLNDKGQMTNDKGIYNLSGQRVAQPTRGLYIVNGKKYIVK